MPRNGSGTYTRTDGVRTGSTVFQQQEALATGIQSTLLDTEAQDMADALTSSIAKDGQTTPTADLPMGGFNHTGVDDAIANDQYGSFGQNNKLYPQVVATSGGSTADALVVNISPTPSDLVDGQPVIVFSTVGANTSTTPTLNLNSFGAKTIVKGTNDALVAGDMPGTNSVSIYVYDSGLDKFVLLNAYKIETDNLVDDSVTNAKIASGAVDTTELAADAVTNSKIAAGAVDTTELAADAVTNAKIAADAVTNAKIAADAVTNAKIANYAVDTDQLANYSVVSDKVPTNEIPLNRLVEVTSPVLVGLNTGTGPLTTLGISSIIDMLGFDGTITSSGADFVIPLSGNDLRVKIGSGNSTVDTSEVFNFGGTAFSNAAIFVFALQTNAGGGLSLSVTSTTTTHFTIDRDDAISGSVNFDWIAFGQA
jgi:hypothetical protein